MRPSDLDAALYEKTFGIGERDISTVLIRIGQHWALIRKESAAILDLDLSCGRILTSPTSTGDTLQPIKIDASHTMLPAGPNELGPQHGVSRYLKYQVEESSCHGVSLSAYDRTRNLGHLKTFNFLISGGLEIVDDVVNMSEQEQKLSLGEHLYFPCKESTISGIRLLHNGDGNGTAIRAICSNGETLYGTMVDFWPLLKDGESLHAEFKGYQAIEINGNIVEISATAKSDAGDERVDLLIWHRPNTDTICFEPVCGTSKTEQGKLQNQEIPVLPGSTVMLTTIVNAKRY